MKLKIFESETLIGDAFVFALDRGMCVAMAKFSPATDYDAQRHANVINGDYVGDRSEILRIEMADGLTIKSEAISIQDYEVERQIDVIGIFEPSFDELFEDYPRAAD